VDHGQPHVATEVDHVAFLQAALDAPFATEHLERDCFTLWNLIRLAHEAKRVAAVLLKISVAVCQLRVGAVDVYASAARFEHLGVAAGVVAVHVGVDDDPQIRGLPADLFERGKEGRARHARGARVDDGPSGRVGQIAIDDAVAFERRRDLEYARVNWSRENIGSSLGHRAERWDSTLSDDSRSASCAADDKQM
jgi:hypothetical protein